MENPCLTFVTPTLLVSAYVKYTKVWTRPQPAGYEIEFDVNPQVGDRSLVDVVAHEIAHSWTGNLVSAQNFEHFWLNEGFTVFTERKILGRTKGEPFRHFSAIGGLKDLRQAVSLTNIVENVKYLRYIGLQSELFE